MKYLCVASVFEYDYTTSCVIFTCVGTKLCMNVNCYFQFGKTCEVKKKKEPRALGKTWDVWDHCVCFVVHSHAVQQKYKSISNYFSSDCRQKIVLSSVTLTHQRKLFLDVQSWSPFSHYHSICVLLVLTVLHLRGTGWHWPPHAEH